MPASMSASSNEALQQFWDQKIKQVARYGAAVFTETKLPETLYRTCPHVDVFHSTSLDFRDAVDQGKGSNHIYWPRLRNIFGICLRLKMRN